MLQNLIIVPGADPLGSPNSNRKSEDYLETNKFEVCTYDAYRQCSLAKNHEAMQKIWPSAYPAGFM